MSVRLPRGAVALAVCLVAVLALYAPVLRFGLVAEDFQLALKGAKVAENPLELFRPFQLVWRPAVYTLFAVLTRVAGPLALWYRVAQVVVGISLAASGWVFLRRVAGLGPWVAATAVLVWVTSPLANEPFCGEALFVGHLLFGASALAALWLFAGRPSRRRSLGVALAVLIAAACKEEWIVLPAMLLAEDLVLHGRSVRQALRGARWWPAAVGGYLAAYGAITHFGYSSFYHLSFGAFAAKALSTLVSFLQLSELPLWGFSQAILDAPWQAVGAILVFGAMAIVAVVRRLRFPLLLFACSALSALPTLASASQAARWTFLPWFFFLGGVVAWLRDAGPAVWRKKPVCVCGATLLLAIAGTGVATTRRDMADWAKLAHLTATLERETPPLLDAGAQGRWLLVLRLDDGGPWRELLSNSEGKPKPFFPRPDDPYGIVSLSALLSWQTYRRGWVLERVEYLPSDVPAVAFAHADGGFRRLVAVPRVVVHHPLRPASGVAGVILKPRPWADFAPREFP